MIRKRDESKNNEYSGLAWGRKAKVNIKRKIIRLKKQNKRVIFNCINGKTWRYRV